MDHTNRGLYDIARPSSAEETISNDLRKIGVQNNFWIEKISTFLTESPIVMESLLFIPNVS